MKRDATTPIVTDDPDMSSEYDFSNEVRGKYAQRFKGMQLKVTPGSRKPTLTRAERDLLRLLSRSASGLQLTRALASRQRSFRTLIVKMRLLEAHSALPLKSASISKR